MNKIKYLIFFFPYKFNNLNFKEMNGVYEYQIKTYKIRSMGVILNLKSFVY